MRNSLIYGRKFSEKKKGDPSKTRNSHILPPLSIDTSPDDAVFLSLLPLSTVRIRSGNRDLSGTRRKLERRARKRNS